MPSERLPPQHLLPHRLEGSYFKTRTGGWYKLEGNCVLKADVKGERLPKNAKWGEPTDIHVVQAGFSALPMDELNKLHQAGKEIPLELEPYHDPKHGGSTLVVTGFTHGNPDERRLFRTSEIHRVITAPGVTILPSSKPNFFGRVRRFLGR